jgi:hypothetical protein
MQMTKDLFTPEEAFARLGQTRDTGCLVILNQATIVRVFVRDALAINVYGEGQDGPQGEALLHSCFQDPTASYLWMPGMKPPAEIFKINITAHGLKLAMAKDIHLAKTSSVDVSRVDVSSLPPAKRPKHYYLTPEDTPMTRIALNKGTLILGRDESCDIVLERTEISRRHCLLQQIVRGLAFRDLESANGTFVNGIRAAQGFIHANDKIRLGSVNFTVHLDSR